MHKNQNQRADRWSCGDHVFTFGPGETLVMGILNVTPDSFSDGGTHNGFSEALEWARRMRDEGADIIDVGGESTRPGFDEEGVTLEEERRRVLPVVEALVKEGFIVSVDTSKPEMMTDVAALGAHIINDIRGFTAPGALEAAAATKCGLVVMHRAEEPHHYDDLHAEVEAFLREQTVRLEALGVDPSRICWDPGFGFGKTVVENFSLVKATDRYTASGYPFLMGLSRKRAIGAATGVGAARDRVQGSVAGALISAERGAHVVRVHDVEPTVQALAVWREVAKAP